MGAAPLIVSNFKLLKSDDLTSAFCEGCSNGATCASKSNDDYFHGHISTVGGAATIAQLTAPTTKKVMITSDRTARHFPLQRKYAIAEIGMQIIGKNQARIGT